MKDENLNIAKDTLFSNKKYFESCVLVAEKLYKHELYEDCISYIEKTAKFGWFNFSGYYKSSKLENLLSTIKDKILSEKNVVKKGSKSNKILHICSEIYKAGGHTKLLYNWIKLDEENNHTILSTRLSVEDIKSVSKYYTKNYENIEHISVLSQSKIASANLLNSAINNNYDFIILHTHPDETLINIVFSQKEIQIPVLLVNHADHVFWLGSQICDFVLQIRDLNIPLDEKRRNIPSKNQFHLPIPLEKIDSPIISKKLKNNSITLLSTGTEYKYTPNDNYNFLEEAFRVVQNNPKVHFHIVGISADSHLAKLYQHPNLKLHGIIPLNELQEIENITDLYIEGFPVPSFTAILQAAIKKIPFLLHYNPKQIFQAFSENKDFQICYPTDVFEWREKIQLLISDDGFRKEVGEKQFKYISSNYSENEWKQKLHTLYNLAKNDKHEIRPKADDQYYFGDNELLLVQSDSLKIHHYSFTEKLPFLDKLLLLKNSNIKNKNVKVPNSKQLLQYFKNKE